MSAFNLSFQTFALFNLKAGIRIGLAILIFTFMALPLSASTIIADLSRKDVAITTDFHGTELLLFGAVKGEEEDDIIVVFSGPQTKIASRKKEKVSGIWVNTKTVLWQNAPSFTSFYQPDPKMRFSVRPCRLNIVSARITFHYRQKHLLYLSQTMLNGFNLLNAICRSLACGKPA